MQEIFLSYRREDSAGYAGRLYDDLAAHFGDGVVFRDVDTLVPGVDFDATIRSTVPGCKALLVVIGRDWVAAKRDGNRRIDDPHDYVRVEVETALGHGIPVIPVLVGRATMPEPADLPPSLRPLSTRNAIELDDTRWRFDIGRLVAALESSVARRSRERAASDTHLDLPTQPVPTAAPPAARRRRRAPVLALGVAVPVLLLVGTVALGGGDDPKQGAAAATTSTTLAPVTTVSTTPAVSAPTTTTAAPAAAGPGAQAPSNGGGSAGGGGGGARVAPQSPAPAPAATTPPATSPPVTSPPPTSPPTTAAPPPAVVFPAPGSAKLTVSPLAARSGSTLTVSGTACQKPTGWTGGQIYWGVSNWSNGKEEAGARELDIVPGSGWSDSFTLPSGLSPGSFGVWANCYAWDPVAGAWKWFYDYPTVEIYVS